MHCFTTTTSIFSAYNNFTLCRGHSPLPWLYAPGDDCLRINGRRVHVLGNERERRLTVTRCSANAICWINCRLVSWTELLSTTSTRSRSLVRFHWCSSSSSTLLTVDDSMLSCSSTLMMYCSTRRGFDVRSTWGRRSQTAFMRTGRRGEAGDITLISLEHIHVQHGWV